MSAKDTKWNQAPKTTNILCRYKILIAFSYFPKHILLAVNIQRLGNIHQNEKTGVAFNSRYTACILWPGIWLLEVNVDVEADVHKTNWKHIFKTVRMLAWMFSMNAIPM